MPGIPRIGNRTDTNNVARAASPLDTSGLLPRIDRFCLSLIASRLSGARCQILLWNGLSVSCSPLPPIGVVTIRDRATLWQLMWNVDPGFGEGYMNGSIEVTGDFVRLMESVNLALTAHKPKPRRPLETPRRLAARLAKPRVQHHYDIGNDFFRLWLDDAMVYTCAYYATPAMSLEEAQQAKLEYVCRKIRLQPGDRVIEAGSGWGALALHMAIHHGAIVRAYNISKEQLAYARAQAKRLGVEDRVTFIDGDFRAISGECDAFVSVGMLEHIGMGAYKTLGDTIDRVLHPTHGRGLLHFIGRNHRVKVAKWSRRYIFPGTYAPVLSEVAERVLEPRNLSVVDVENLRRHYAATLRDWRVRFERKSEEVSRMFDERFVRMWRLYLSCAEASFESGDSQLFQVTFERATDPASRWTRADLYEAADDASFGTNADDRARVV